MPKVNLYRNIAITFIAVAVVLAVSVCFFSYSKAVITITPDTQNVKLSFNAEVKANPDSEELAEKDIISGYFVSANKTEVGSFNVSTTKMIAKSNIVGRVKIVNESSKSQTLVKTTQLQSETGVIVRTNQSIVVPAGGSVSVEVFPKEPASFTELEPGTFKIIKLNPALQEKIYGTSEEVLSSEAKEVGVLGTNDINKAKAELSAKMTADFRQEMNLSESEALAVKVIKVKTDKKVGDEATSFNLELTLEIKRLNFEQSQLLALINRKIKNLNISMPPLSKLEPGDLKVVVTDQTVGGPVQIKVDYEFHPKLDVANPVLSRKEMAGKGIEEVKEELESSGVVKEAVIKVSPTWEDKLPNKPERIKIIIKE